MTARLFVLLIVLCSTHTGLTQEPVEATPRTFLDYLKPELPIGVQSVQGTDVIIHVYTSGDFETAAMIVGYRSIFLASEVAEANDAVREQLTAYLKEHAIPESEADSLRLMPLIRTSLATVSVVGNDYVLVELRSNTKTKRRKLIPKSRIGAIYLDANPVRFLERPSRRDRDRG